MKQLSKLSYYLLISLIGLIVLLPFLWMASTSLKEPGTVFSFPAHWLPQKITWENYRQAFRALPIGRGYINSVFISVTIVFGQLLTCSMAAYAFSRLKFPGRDKIFFLYLSTLMVPYYVTMIPVFMLIRLLPVGLNSLFHTQFWSTNMYIGNFYLGKPVGLDSYFALIVPSCFSAYGTFLLRQFFMGIPEEITDSAKIDGCNHFCIYAKMIIPLSKPALAALGTLTFMNAWKNYLWPLIIADDPRLMPLSVLLQWFQGLHTTDWTLLMAGSIIALVPIAAVFLINQRFLIKGIQIETAKF